MEWIDGAMPETAGDWRAVAAYLQRLHEITAGWTDQRPGWRTCTELLTYEASGPVDLAQLPPAVVETCRGTWARLPHRTPSIVHGDPNPTNIRITNGTVCLLDWDEARLDHPLLDVAYLSPEASGIDPADHHAGQQAFYAWEAALFWNRNREHAQRRLDRLRPWPKAD